MLYDRNDLFSRLYNNDMYILLHTYNYAITVYVLLGVLLAAFAFFQRVLYIMFVL